MKHFLKLRKGLDLRLEGALTTENIPAGMLSVKEIAIVPDDFPGFAPRPAVKAGDSVEAGTPLLHDKFHPEVCLVSPAAGTVREIVRGARRHIERVIVDLAPDAAHAGRFDRPEGADALRGAMMRSGLWAMMRQRPYDIVPDPSATPRDIFVTLTDTAPLALNPATALAGRVADMEAGVAALAKLTPGKVYVAVPAGSAIDLKGAEMVEVKGPHPAGNAGVIAAGIAPVGKGQTIWTLDGATLAAIGELAAKGTVDYAVTVAVTGPEVVAPAIVRTLPGAPMTEILKGNIKISGRDVRVISGNVLTGVNAGREGWLHYPYRQVTVILEGNDADEFMGWASLSPKKMSRSRTFLSWLMPGRRYSPDARINGGRRAMIMSGVYEDLVPMDIMPEHLVKAVLSRNIPQMEALGIYEVAPEDFAAAEWADPSKLELQKIIREGLDYLRKELS